MTKLLKIAFSKSAYRWLLSFTLLFAIGFTIATQLEMFTLGIVTRKGPDFFELFGSKNHTDSISHAELQERWNELAGSEKDTVTRAKVTQFMETHHREGVVDRGIDTIQKYLPIDQDVFALIIVIVFVALFKAVSLFFYRFGTKVFAINISRDIRLEYFEHIQSLPMSFFQEHNIGALSSRAVNDAYIIADGINSTLVNYIQTPFAFIST